MFVFKGLHPASCDLRREGNGLAAWCLGGESGGLLAFAGLGNLGFVWGRCLRLCNLIQRGQERKRGRMDLHCPLGAGIRQRTRGMGF